MLNKEILSLNVIVLLQLIIDYVDPSNKIIEVLIDTCMVIMIFLNHNANTNESQMLCSVIYNLLVWYFKKVALPRISVLAYDYYNSCHQFTSIDKKSTKEEVKKPLECIAICFKYHLSKIIRIILDYFINYTSFHFEFTSIDYLLIKSICKDIDKEKEYNKQKEKYDLFILDNDNIIKSFKLKGIAIIKSAILLCSKSFSITHSVS